MSEAAFFPNSTDRYLAWNPSNSNGAIHAFSGNSGNSSSSRSQLPWLTPERLTISFAPDGTRISSYQSNLFASFQDLMTAQELESQVLRAFQEWAQHSAINAGLKTDSGLQFGVSGPTQGDRRIGDIRIGAIPMAEDAFAVAIPHDSLISGTWSGEILFNSNKTFASVTEFFAVALHEAGHVLGLEHSNNPGSAMFPGALNTVVTGHDILSLRERYGARRLDPEDIGNRNNNSFDKATTIRNTGSVNGTVPLIVFGDIGSAADTDFFELPPLSGYTGPIKFELVTSGISLLRPRLSIYNEQQVLLTSITGSGDRGNRFSYTLPAAVEGEKYFARVEAADTSLHSFGSYALKTTIEDNLVSGPTLTEKVLLGNYWQLKQQDVQGIFLSPQSFFFNQEFRLNDTFLTAETLKTTLAFNASKHFTAIGSLSYLNDRDVYQIKSPSSLPAGNTMTVSLLMMGGSQMVPRVQVYDGSQTLLPANVLVNGNGELVLQVAGVQPGQVFFVRVMAENAGDAYDMGNYQMMARFDQPAVPLPILGSGTLTSASETSRRQEHGLYVAETQMFHLALSANTTATRENAQVWVTIYDQVGNPVFRTLTVPGQTRSAKSVILRPGSYTIFVSLATAAGAGLQSLNYSLKGTGITDPIGPELINPANKPFKKAGPGDPNYVYPGNRLSPGTFLVGSGDSGITPPQLLKEPPMVNPNAWYNYTSWLVTDVPNM